MKWHKFSDKLPQDYLSIIVRKGPKDFYFDVECVTGSLPYLSDCCRSWNIDQDWYWIACRDIIYDYDQSIVTEELFQKDLQHGMDKR